MIIAATLLFVLGLLMGLWVGLWAERQKDKPPADQPPADQPPADQNRYIFGSFVFAEWSERRWGNEKWKFFYLVPMAGKKDPLKKIRPLGFCTDTEANAQLLVKKFDEVLFDELSQDRLPVGARAEGQV